LEHELLLLISGASISGPHPGRFIPKERNAINGIAFFVTLFRNSLLPASTMEF